MAIKDTLSPPRTRPPAVVAAWAVTLVLLCGWVFLPAFVDMAGKWSSDPQYSHGYLVPFFALGVLFLRRERLAGVTYGFYWSGLPLIAAGVAAYVAGAMLGSDTLTGLAVVPTAAGLFTLFGGRKLLAWGWPAAGFLVFMVPLPYQIEVALSVPLRRLATVCSTWVIQLLGFPAVSEGNVIILEHGRVAVVEACSGLGMLLTFFALAAAILVVAPRPVIDKLAVLVTVPVIALIANVARISSNGVAVELWGPETAHDLFHDQAGWLMMPVAVTLLVVELWILARLFPPARAARDVLQKVLIPGLIPGAVPPAPPKPKAPTGR